MLPRNLAVVQFPTGHGHWMRNTMSEQNCTCKKVIVGSRGNSARIQTCNLDQQHLTAISEEDSAPCSTTNQRQEEKEDQEKAALTVKSGSRIQLNLVIVWVDRLVMLTRHTMQVTDYERGTCTASEHLQTNHSWHIG